MPIPGLSYTDEQLFTLTNAVLPCWVLLLIAPQAKITHALTLLVSFLLCVLYTLLVVPGLLKPGGGEAFKDFMSLAGIIKLFSKPDIVFAGWVHYGVSDLWVGHWIALDAAKRRVPRLLLAPVLVLACLLGPIGLGVYFIVRTPFKPGPVRHKHD